jgi:hypothetical protein
MFEHLHAAMGQESPRPHGHLSYALCLDLGGGAQVHLVMEGGLADKTDLDVLYTLLLDHAARSRQLKVAFNAEGVSCGN